jgi:hypothetical protein
MVPAAGQAPAADYRALADRRLAQLAAIARIGAEPPGAVLAIVQGTDPGLYAPGSPDDIRRDLTASSEAWRKHYREWLDEMEALKEAGAEVPEVLGGAMVASLTASLYAYTLAAVLGAAEKEMGPRIAGRLADIARTQLDDGDDQDFNADVAPGTPLPPPTARELERAGQLTLEDAKEAGAA